jgi:hypothetical protein
MVEESETSKLKCRESRGMEKGEGNTLLRGKLRDATFEMTVFFPCGDNAPKMKGRDPLGCEHVSGEFKIKFIV